MTSILRHHCRSVTVATALLACAGCAPTATVAPPSAAAPVPAVAAPVIPAIAVPPVGETVAVATLNADAADDPAIWAAPPGRRAMLAGASIAGFIAGTDKQAGLYIYGLEGNQLQFIADGLLNNVDLREGFMVGGRPHVLIGASDRGRMGVALYLFDPASTDPANAIRAAGFIASDVAEPYGFCMGRAGNEHHAVLIGKDGEARVYAVENEGAGGREIARFAIGSQSEGCVVDETGGYFYVGEEARGLWRYELGAPQNRVLVELVGNGRLVADVEGVTLIADGAARYLLVSSQGDSAFAVWRIDGAEPVWRGRFSVTAAGGIDAVTGTDGLDARGGPVGDWPEGLVVVQDDENEGMSQNFKLIDWRDIRAALRIER
ncbi:MAG: phytase [Sphingomonadaceae bacterium]|nr:phytase [Sphingomonadaceae bacterium]